MHHLAKLFNSRSFLAQFCQWRPAARSFKARSKWSINEVDDNPILKWLSSTATCCQSRSFSRTMPHEDRRRFFLAPPAPRIELVILEVLYLGVAGIHKHLVEVSARHAILDVFPASQALEPLVSRQSISASLTLMRSSESELSLVTLPMASSGAPAAREIRRNKGSTKMALVGFMRHISCPPLYASCGKACAGWQTILNHSGVRASRRNFTFAPPPCLALISTERPVLHHGDRTAPGSLPPPRDQQPPGNAAL